MDSVVVGSGEVVVAAPVVEIAVVSAGTVVPGVADELEPPEQPAVMSAATKPEASALFLAGPNVTS